MAQLLVRVSHACLGVLNRIAAIFGRGATGEVTVGELVGWLEQRSARGKPLVLVDVRSDREREISMIPGAISKADFEQAGDVYRDAVVVSYCTVGGRSFAYTRQLSQQGFDAVNFKASIIGWCEAEQELMTPGGEPTNRVHVYSSAFSVPERYEAVTQ